MPFLRHCLTILILATTLPFHAVLAQENESLQPTECTPEGSLWFDFIRSEREAFNESLDFGIHPGIRIELPSKIGRQGHVGIYQEGIFSKDKWLLQKHPIVDLTNHFLKPRAAEEYDKEFPSYRGLILPPGANNQLFPDEPELDAGRAGAILVVPWYTYEKACEQAGLPGLVIHSGSMRGNPLLDRVPSLVMSEDELAQLIANIIAVRGIRDEKYMNRSYSVVVEENAGWMGLEGFSAFKVNFETRKRSFWEWLSGADYGSEIELDPVPDNLEPQPLPRVMSYAELRDLTDRIALGYVWYMNEFERLKNGFHQQIQSLQSLGKPDPNSPQFHNQVKSVSEIAGELLVFIPEYLDVMRSYTPDYLNVSQELYDEHMKLIEDWHKDLQEYQYQLDDQVVAMERIDAAKYLDLNKEFDQPSLPTDACNLLSQSIPIRQVQIPVENHRFNANGRVGVYFVKEAPGSVIDGVAVRMKLKAALNVSQLYSIQSALVRENLPSSSCSERFKVVGGNELYADGRGNINGKTTVRYELHACSTFNYPCWRGWKTYTCRKTASTRLLRHTRELGFFLRPTVDEENFIIRITGATADRIELSPDAMDLDIDDYNGIRQLLGLKPEDSFFSENNDGLWYVAQMQSKPLLPEVACSIQDRLVKGGN